VTVTALEVTSSRALSFTWSSKEYVPVVDRVPVDIDAGEVHEEELPKSL
jgi:hypothetical protein